MTVRHWYLPREKISSGSPQPPGEIAAALGGESAAERYGLKAAQGADDDWYWVAKLHLGDEVFKHVQSLGPGQVYGPWNSSDGVHFARVEKNVAPIPLTFEQAHDQIAADYAKAAQARLTEDTLKFLRNRAHILMADDYSDYHP